jgi:CRP/FNR family transcriptional regulator, cyclic AMP receptor protein
MSKASATGVFRPDFSQLRAHCLSCGNTLGIVSMHWLTELIGLIGQGKLLLSAWMTRIIPLRLLSMSAGVFTGIYAYVTGFWPALLLATLQLPINLLLLRSARRTMADIARAQAPDHAAGILRRYGLEESASAGQVLFRRGDPASAVYLINTGVVLLPELGIRLEQGDVLGEMGLFSRGNTRDQSAVCETDVTLTTLGRDAFHDVHDAHPEIGFALMSLIRRRLEPRAAPADGALAP